MAQHDFGIVIGIDRYRDLDRLVGAVSDAGEFHRWMLEGGSVPEENAALITSPAKGRLGKPVHDQIDDDLTRLIELATKRGARRLYLYFAGHGLSAEESHVNLILANASKTLMNRGLDAQSYHRTLLEGRWFKELVCFYDCCRTVDTKARGLPPGFAPVEEQTRAGQGSGQSRAGTVTQYVLYAVLVGQRSVERRRGADQRGSGLFTRALLDGLRGGAAMPASQGGGFEVTTASLTEFIARELQDAGRRGALQEPAQDQAGTTRRIVLVTNVVPAPTRVTFRCAPDASEVVFLTHRSQPCGRSPVVNGCGFAELPPGLYSARVLPAQTIWTFQVGIGLPDVLDFTDEV